MTSLVLVLDDDTAGHLAQALAAHCLRLRRDGRIVPSTVTQLLDAVAAHPAARHGHTRTSLDEAAGRLLTYRQAAGLLGVSERTVRRWVQVGALRPVRWAGGRPRVLADEVLSLGAERQAG